MILQALNRYYERSDSLPRPGWVRRGVDYVVVLDGEGICVGLDAIGELKKGKTIPAERLVTAIGKQAMKHTNSGKDANLLWDNASFVFGTGNKGTIKLSSFIETLDDWFDDMQDTGVDAVKRFCRNLQTHPDEVDALFERFQVKEDFDRRDPVLTFQLAGDIESIHMRPAVRKHYEEKLASTQSGSELRGDCLVTGKRNVPLAPNECVIKGVWGGQPAGCNIVSFNARAFKSYGKRERNGENAPVSVHASFAYTTALNHLLSSPQRIQVGDASTVFWAEERHDLETAVPDLFGDPPKDDPDKNVRAVEALYSAIASGKFSEGALDTRLHVLGLAPNAARISVRFWETATAIELGHRIKQHFNDLDIAHADYEPRYLSLFRLLTGVALLNKADNIPPTLGGEVMRAIVEGRPYPVQLLNLAVIRCRAEQRPTRARAAAIKAVLNRLIRSRKTIEQEFLPMLDPTNVHPAYRLGRLFAVLEKIQEDASPSLNATIRDRYYAAASSAPVSVFTTLLRLKNHHLGKLNPGRATQMEKLIGDILGEVPDFPTILSLPDQGRFALGYYHQRQAFFTKSDSKNQEESA
ncbi:type I-C CRISPR-associated protein Cas8c/Csd1 [Xanthomonas translucens]|uniref:type I-C CRISPR-associated protein Cas8c/Csd1 n=1 Tax=Xanthomonas campestris pv. translucens TaxID=343 RepID=UPI00071E8C5C|nr:type I-C CRISPR-associated protein Cas8c/Csd1 [Xanthomonas translucens]QEO25186.1 type I-C CRISPR-associated protein Cas8c/Csd1 [Xanthomonas translucens pv. undulosa]WLA09021.1 type I-C CRISPR-associated protein Cas8c/Csd1 [Xanthomonas translucens]